VLGERALERRCCADLVAPRCRKQSAAAGGAGERPFAVERDGALLDPVEQPLSLAVLADGDRCLRLHGEREEHRRFLHAGCVQGLRRLPRRWRRGCRTVE
jgi:hypothetical protein